MKNAVIETVVNIIVLGIIYYLTKSTLEDFKDGLSIALLIWIYVNCIVIRNILRK